LRLIEGEHKAKIWLGMSYVELHAASAFSFLDAASTPEILVERAAALGYPGIAVADRDGVYGIPRFHLAAKKAGLRAMVGAELTIRTARHAYSPHPPSLWRLPVLVASREGYRNLCRLLTRMKQGAPKGEVTAAGGALNLEDLDGATGGLIALAGRAVLGGARHGVGGLLDRLVGVFGRDRLYVELQRHLQRDEEADNQALLTLASAYHVPIVATNGVRFATPEDRPLYDVLTCIRHKTDVHRAGHRLAQNAERYLKSPAQMARLFDDLPQAIAASRELADRLEYTMADLGYRFPDYPVPPGESQASFLRKVTDVGARERYRPFHERARAQIARELDLIEKLDLAGYFLIVWDIVNFCRQHDILVQGRGSAANSAVCYSLGITAVDPVGMELLFERFLSEQRGEWPDIDLDLPSGDRREQVIQYVYQRYGARGAAMTANVITYRGRSAAREVGKALGLDAGHIDRLARVMHQFEFIDPADTLARQLNEVGLSRDDERVRQFVRLWQQMQDLPRHLGQHSGGMVVAQGELSSVVPLENASMPGRVVVQWDKEDCADMGIIKVDLLGLGMMAVLQDALAIVNRSTTPPVDLAHLPPDDPDVYHLLQTADTIGVFQVESRAQMATLPRLQPKCFYDLVVEVAIIRPGPIVGQMVHPYLNRRRGNEPVTYPHPSLEPVLKRTLGVPLFQEQLLRIAMVVANFTGGEAEELRRAMGFKRSEARMRAIEVRLREGMAQNGITGEAADAIILAITSFALYGFPESHAASFALIVYASAYLKTYFPSAFYAALLNNQPMGFYHPATLVKDAQRRGVRFRPIDVQVSHWDCTVEEDGAIRIGLRYVDGLRAEVGQRIAPSRPAAGGATADKPPVLRCPKCGCDDDRMIEREQAPDAWFCNLCAHPFVHRASRAEAASAKPGSEGGRFGSLEQFVAATGVREDELTTLASIGALNAFGCDRREALWQVARAVRPAGALFDESRPDAAAGPPVPSWADTPARPAARVADARVTGSDGAAAGQPAALPGPVARGPLLPLTPLERVVADYDGTGLTIGPHPMSYRRAEMALRGVLRAADLPKARGGRRVRVAGAVITRQRPGTAKGFVFLTLEDETGVANVIVRPDVYDAHRMSVIEAPFLLVEGILQQQEGVTSVRAERLYVVGGGPAAGESGEAMPPVPSRDFR
jgi:error-prone DNA polymerase